jgi:penicillin-binding protein 1A
MKSRRFEKIVKISVTVFMLAVTTLIVAGMAFYLYFAKDLPSIENLKNYKPATITRIYSEDQEVIGEFFVEKREVVPLERMPHHLIQSFVAGEDSRFFQHKGIDYMAILRAFSRNLFSGELLQGGSTITQQVVKSLLLSPEKKLTRKIREAILAFKIESYLSKEEILYLYLNQIYLGHGAYGVAAAAEDYFGKPVEDLNLAESAMLAGLPKSPNRHSPLGHPEQAKRRQSYILNRMVEEGMISYGESKKALNTSLNFRNRPESSQDQAPHFVEYVRRYIDEKYGKDALYKNGLKVYTTVDTRMQKTAQEAVETGLKEIEKREKFQALNGEAPEGSLVCFDLETGYIKAMVGGRDFKKSQFNRATQAKRQTGSSFKPIVYASALDKGYTPATIIMDTPIVFEWGDKKWKPKNFEGKYMGPTTLRDALTHSVNIVTIKIAQDVGIDYIKEYAKKMGISSPLHDGLAMALGSSSLNLYELTKAYAIFAKQGNLFKPVFIKRILDRDGNLLEENLPLSYPHEIPEEEQVLTPQTAFLMTHLMESVVQNGTG